MFISNMLIAAEQVIILYIMALIGAVADKTGVYTEKVAKSCTDLLFYIVTPAKIIESFINLEYSVSALKGLFAAIGIGLIMMGIAAVGSIPMFNKLPDDDASVYKYSCVYGNCGYMGLPLIEAVLGNEGVFYCSAVIIAFQIFTFTHGICLINRGRKENQKIDFKKLILNPGVLPVFIGLPLFVLSTELPNVLYVPIKSLASLNSPLAMLIFGTYIANTDFKSLKKQWRISFICLYKLLLLPLVMMGVLKLFGITGVLFTAITITAATPPANNTVMFSAKYDRNTGLASQIVATVSFISILTLPIVIALAKIIAGV